MLTIPKFLVIVTANHPNNLPNPITSLFLPHSPFLPRFALRASSPVSKRLFWWTRKPNQKPFQSTMPGSSMLAEYAKSNRSTCKACSKAIESKALRLGVVAKGKGGFDITKWHHLDCFPFPSDSESLLASPEDAIKGFSSLKSTDQEALKKILVAAHDKSQKKVDKAIEDIQKDEGRDTKRRKLCESDIEAVEEINFSVSEVKNNYKDATLLPKWKAFQTVIYLERVIFTNESNIERWKNKRQVAVDSKIGRLNNFIEKVKVPIQVFIACGVGKGKADGKDDPFRKPKSGMWHLMQQHLNSGIAIDMDQSFYVGDAAGRESDHSDADIKFAEAIGLKFFVPEEYFDA
ncbi:polynucleotide 3'-phosphatase ZDP isoform X3 [Arachis duranensis]|uniref:Polynucleotide 3'-phosphatase ZDP isoform X3 n=1 Tax=Arachis duranensis TaxID=130453 RepID=A0A9C6TQI9_ARADU|nr:polynucleotide 3'-phosphatase ZDP isoform X3 [Arachis duranensis]